MPTARHYSAADAVNSISEFSTYAGNPDFVLSARGLRVSKASKAIMTAAALSKLPIPQASPAPPSDAFSTHLNFSATWNEAARSTGSKPRCYASVFPSSLRLPWSRQHAPSSSRSRNKLHESSSMSMLDGGEIVYVARSAASRILAAGLSVGSRLPAYCTSMGRVLLCCTP